MAQSYEGEEAHGWAACFRGPVVGNFGCRNCLQGCPAQREASSKSSVAGFYPNASRGLPGGADSGVVTMPAAERPFRALLIPGLSSWAFGHLLNDLGALGWMNKLENPRVDYWAPDGEGTGGWKTGA